MAFKPSYHLKNLAEHTSGVSLTNTNTSPSAFYDHEGVLVETFPNETVSAGARREYNYMGDKQDVTLWTKSGTGATVVDSGDGAYRVTLPAGAGVHDRTTETFSIDVLVAAYASVKLVSGSTTGLAFSDPVGGSTGLGFNDLQDKITSVYTVVSDDGRILGAHKVGVWLRNYGTGTIVIDVTKVGIIVVTGRSNKSPPEHLIDINYGYGVDGVKYYADTNGNSVSGNVVTEAAGTAVSPVPQIQLQPQRTNSLWPSRDLTHANWAATNITPLLDAVGVDGKANAASTLTATAANGTIFNAITIASAGFTNHFQVKRKTGTGVIEFTDDGGTTYTAITGDINSSTFSEVKLTRTQANPSIGFRIVTSGDEIIVDFAQNEEGTQPTTPIETTTVAVTRSADKLDISDFSTWFNADNGVVIFGFTPDDDWTNSGAAEYLYDGASAKLAYMTAGADGLYSTDGTTTSSSVNNNTAGDEVIASIIYDKTNNYLCVGYSQDTMTTMDWDGTPATFDGFTAAATLVLMNTLSERSTIRSLAMYSGMPPSTSDISTVQAWVGDNAVDIMNDPSMSFGAGFGLTALTKVALTKVALTKVELEQV